MTCRDQWHPMSSAELPECRACGVSVTHNHGYTRRRKGHTRVTVTFNALALSPKARTPSLTSFMLIFEMKLFALQSCQPFGPLHRLPKKTSSVSGNHTGASCAKIAPGCVAIALMDGFSPRTRRNSG